MVFTSQLAMPVSIALIRSRTSLAIARAASASSAATLPSDHVDVDARQLGGFVEGFRNLASLLNRRVKIGRSVFRAQQSEGRLGADGDD